MDAVGERWPGVPGGGSDGRLLRDGTAVATSWVLTALEATSQVFHGLRRTRLGGLRHGPRQWSAAPAIALACCHDLGPAGHGVGSNSTARRRSHGRRNSVARDRAVRDVGFRPTASVMPGGTVPRPRPTSAPPPYSEGPAHVRPRPAMAARPLAEKVVVPRGDTLWSIAADHRRWRAGQRDRGRLAAVVCRERRCHRARPNLLRPG